MEQAKMNSCQNMGHHRLPYITYNIQLNMKTYLPSVQEVLGKVLNLFILTPFILFIQCRLLFISIYSFLHFII